MGELGCVVGSQVLWDQLQLPSSGKIPTAVGSSLLSRQVIPALCVAERFFMINSFILCSFPWCRPVHRARVESW